MAAVSASASASLPPPLPIVYHIHPYPLISTAPLPALPAPAPIPFPTALVPFPGPRAIQALPPPAAAPKALRAFHLIYGPAPSGIRQTFPIGSEACVVVNKTGILTLKPAIENSTENRLHYFRNVYIFNKLINNFIETELKIIIPFLKESYINTITEKYSGDFLKKELKKANSFSRREDWNEQLAASSLMNLLPPEHQTHLKSSQNLLCKIDAFNQNHPHLIDDRHLLANSPRCHKIKIMDLFILVYLNAVIQKNFASQLLDERKDALPLVPPQHSLLRATARPFVPKTLLAPSSASPSAPSSAPAAAPSEAAKPISPSPAPGPAAAPPQSAPTRA